MPLRGRSSGYPHVWLLDNQAVGGEIGYDVLIPVRAEGVSSLLLVNLGWVPRPLSREQLPNPVIPADLTLEGVLRTAPVASCLARISRPAPPEPGAGHPGGCPGTGHGFPPSQTPCSIRNTPSSITISRTSCPRKAQGLCGAMAWAGAGGAGGGWCWRGGFPLTPWRRWRVPLLFAAVILLPVLLAALTLRQGWYEPVPAAKGSGCTRIYLLPRSLPARVSGDWSIWWPDPARGCAGRYPS